MASRRIILVTGANKGIGKAICKKLFADYPDIHVVLGSRNLARGEKAVEDIKNEVPDAKNNLVEVVALDVTSDESVEAAAKEFQEKKFKFYGVVNNAGITSSDGSISLRGVLDVNVLGPNRVVESLLKYDLFQDNARIVNVASAAGSMFVKAATESKKYWFTGGMNRAKSLDEIMSEMESACALAEDTSNADVEEACGGHPGKRFYLNDQKEEEGKRYFAAECWSACYCYSKALLNVLTFHQADKLKSRGFIVNSLTPGFIATDLTTPWAVKSGKTPQDMGMKPPSAAVVAPMRCLFELETSGGYYGSDGLRSPIAVYRGPGDEEYLGKY